jgi:RNA polymerase sigma factor (sigma-70 family)
VTVTDALDSLEQIVRDRLALGEDWGDAFIEVISNDEAVQDEVRARAERLSRIVKDHAHSIKDWEDSVRSVFWEKLSRLDIKQVKRLPGYLRRTISSCAVQALRMHFRGQGPRSGRVKVFTSNVSLDSHAAAQDAEMNLGRRRDQDTGDSMLLDSEPRIQAFLVMELKDCVIEQIRRNFPPAVQNVLWAVYVHGLTEAEVARGIDRDPSRISQILKKHREELRRLVRERCLGERP